MINKSTPSRTVFPISRDPPEGGTNPGCVGGVTLQGFPISRDPPEGGTGLCEHPGPGIRRVSNF